MIRKHNANFANHDASETLTDLGKARSSRFATGGGTASDRFCGALGGALGCALFCSLAARTAEGDASVKPASWLKLELLLSRVDVDEEEDEEEGAMGTGGCSGTGTGGGGAGTAGMAGTLEFERKEEGLRGGIGGMSWRICGSAWTL